MQRATRPAAPKRPRSEFERRLDRQRRWYFVTRLGIPALVVAALVVAAIIAGAIEHSRSHHVSARAHLTALQSWCRYQVRVGDSLDEVETTMPRAQQPDASFDSQNGFMLVGADISIQFVDNQVYLKQCR